MEQTKRCAGCGETKPVSQFHRQAQQTDGYRPRCKVCRKAETEVWYRKNEQVIKARTKEWQQRNHAHYLKYLAEWGQKNRQKKLDGSRRYNATHRAEQKEYSKRPEVRVRARQHAKNTKAKRKLAMGATHHPITAEEWQQLKVDAGYRCTYCDVAETVEEPLTQDHVIPLKKGGSHTVDNIVPACGRCNRRKQTMSVAEFIRYQQQHKET